MSLATRDAIRSDEVRNWPFVAGEMAERIRAHDWLATPLGPVGDWPQPLRTAVDIVLAMPGPATILWGPAHVRLYNDAYVQIARNRHPALLGQPAADGWPDACEDVIAPLLAAVEAGRATRLTGFPVELTASCGRSDARVFDVSWSPIHDEAGLVAGALQTLTEVTARIQAEARLRESEVRQAFLLKLSDALRPLPDAASIQREACRILGDHLEVDRAYYAEVDEAAGVATVERDYVRGRPGSLAGTYPIARFAWSVDILRRGECHVVADTGDSPGVPPVDRAALAALRIVACMGAPLIKSGALVGALCVTASCARSWTGAETELLREVAERIWAAVHRARAEEALREGQRLQSAMLAVLPLGLAVLGPAGRVILSNPEWDRFVPAGRMPSQDPQRAWRWRAWDSDGCLVQPGDYPGARGLRGEHVLPGIEFLYTDDAGDEIWTNVASVPLVDGKGDVTGVVSIIHDVDAAKRASAALTAAEARQRALIEGVPQLVWRAMDCGRWTWASRQWTEFTGQSETDSLGLGWLDALHPDDRAGAMAYWRAAEGIGRLEMEIRLYHAPDDRYRWFQTRATAVRDPQGRIVEWLGTSTDIDDLRALQERREVLVAELQHRTRNLLGVVRAIAGQTLRNSATLEDFSAAFNDRLAALSRVQGLLSRSDDAPITMGALLRSELDALAAAEMSQRVVTRGPEVRLRKGTVQTFALALHELATNASKYGALSNGTGRLEVTWWAYTDGTGRRLALEWRETGLDRSRDGQGGATQPGGYGRELIERALPYVLQARTSYDLDGAKLVCTIDLPLAGRTESKGH